MAAANKSQYDNDPLYLSTLINKYVNIDTDKCQYRGFVDTIDPISGSIILSIIKLKKTTTTLINGAVITKVSIEEPPDGCKQCVIEDDQMDTTNIESRKIEVFNWLVRNLLPVKDIDGMLDVHDGSLLVKPPYGTADCVSSNSIILGRVQHLLQNIPKDPLDVEKS